MISTYAAGTVTGTNSEVFLSSPNVQGKFALYLDLANMIDGDYLEVRRYKMVINSGTSRVLDVQTYQGAQPTDLLIAESEPVWNSLVDTNAVRFSVKMPLPTGTNSRTYDWSVLLDDALAPTISGRTIVVNADGSVNAGVSITGTVDANVLLWKGSTPNNLISGTVDAFIHYANPVQAYLTGTMDANVVLWEGAAPNALISGTVDSNIHYPNPIIVVATGTVSANVIQWKGLTPNDLISGTVDAFTHYANPISCYPTGTVNANLVSWEGLVPNALISGTVDSFTHYTNYPSSSITGSVDANVITWRGNQPNNLISGTVDAFVHYSNPVQAFITGTIDANVLLWRGDQPNILITGTVDSFEHYGNPTQSYHTGTIDANLVLWEGIVPNALISGTVDAFAHYSNPIQTNVSITGTIDANVVQWRSEQPNVLISGTVDAYAHYISAGAVTSIWSNATRTLTSFGTLVADIWAAVVDSSGVTTLLSRLTAGRASNLDNLDDAISNVPTATENADALLKRDWTVVTGEASRSVLNALRFIRNKFSTTANPGVVTIYKEDDIAEAYQKPVTTDATADPIVEG